MLCESLLLAALGRRAGGFSRSGSAAASSAFLNTDSSSRVFVDLAPGWRVFAFMSLLTGLACVLFGLTPALRVTHTNPGETMKAGARGTSDAREGVMIRRGLVVLQVALSLVLVVGALLLVGTLRNLMTLDPGFVSSGVLVASLDLRHAGIPPERQTVLVGQMMERVRAIPGVRSAAQSFLTPVNGGTWNNNVVFEAPSPACPISIPSATAAVARRAPEVAPPVKVERPERPAETPAPVVRRDAKKRKKSATNGIMRNVFLLVAAVGVGAAIGLVVLALLLLVLLVLQAGGVVHLV